MYMTVEYNVPFDVNGSPTPNIAPPPT